MLYNDDVKPIVLEYYVDDKVYVPYMYLFSEWTEEENSSSLPREMVCYILKSDLPKDAIRRQFKWNGNECEYYSSKKHYEYMRKQTNKSGVC